jgi:hypothetical protein
MLTQLENLHHFSKSRNNFTLTQFGIDDPWSHLSSVGQQEVTLLHTISHVYAVIMFVIYVASHLVCSSTALAFLTNMSEKCKSPSLSAIQVKNQRKTIGTEEKLHVIS